MTFTSLLGQQCKIYKWVDRKNSFRQSVYEKEYLKGGEWIPCRFDSLAMRTRPEPTPGSIRPMIRGMLFVDYEGTLENNFVAQIDTNGDGMYNFEFEICSVNPVYGFGGTYHHQELEVVDVNYDND